MLYKRLVLNEVRKLIINVVIHEIEYSKTDTQIQTHNINTLRYATNGHFQQNIVSSLCERACHNANVYMVENKL